MYTEYMKYLEFKKQLSKFIIFSQKDIKSYVSNFNLVQLFQWQNKGYIKKLIKGKYIFSEQEINEGILFLISNELLHPSYISLETALLWYGIIPEGVYEITAISTKTTVDYKTDIANFSYKHLKNSGFFGYEIHKIERNGREYKIASIEKAIVDYFYLHKDLNSNSAIEGLRFNSEVIVNDVDFDKLLEYAELMQNKALSKRIKILIKYFSND